MHKAERIRGSFRNIENWHYVGDTDEPAFENSWVNFDSNRPARFYKDAFGIVHLDGIIKTGSIPTVAFTLPEGYRPDHVGAEVHFAVVSNSAFGSLTVSVDGSVAPAVGSSTWVSLSSITFKAAK